MPTQLGEKFITDPAWKEVAKHVDKGLREYGYYNYELLLRPATAVEQVEIGKVFGASDFMHMELDQAECSAVFIFGTDEVTGNTALEYVSPKDLAMISIIDALDEALIGDPFDPDDVAQGRSFKIIDGGKSNA